MEPEWNKNNGADSEAHNRALASVLTLILSPCYLLHCLLHCSYSFLASLQVFVESYFILVYKSCFLFSLLSMKKAAE